MMTLGTLRDGRVSKITKERDERYIDRNIDTIKDVLTSIDFLKNFECELVENITMISGVATALSHRLGAVPRFRIIVRQNGSGVIADSSNAWTNTEIYLVNTGGDQIISVLIFK